MNKKKKKIGFSKIMEIQESILIWITTVSLIVLAYICVFNQYFGELPWITAMCGFPWTAYGVGQSFYYKKAEKENCFDSINEETAKATGLFVESGVALMKKFLED